MTSTPRYPLDAEERELAERLAQLGASAEPSTALDARILGAARAATRMGGVAAATPTTTGRARPRRRWPVAMGVAATLVLAVGIAWQMRPVGETRQTYSEAPAAVQVVDAPSQRPPLRRLPSTEVDAVRPPPAPQMRAMAPPPAPVEAPGKRAEAAPTADEAAGAEIASDSDARTSERRQRDGTAVEVPAEPEPRLLQEAANEAEEVSTAAPSAFPATTGTGTSERKALRQEMQKPPPEIVLDSGAPVQSAPPSPPPPPAAPAPQQREPARTAAPASTAPRESLDRIEITGNRIDRDNDGFSDQVIDDQPPATADSPLVQQAWLQRIRELIARGRIDAARSSLGEFKRRYPRYALPDDLRAFQQGTLAQPADAVHGEGHDAAEDGAAGDEVDADAEDNGGGEAPDASLDATDEDGSER
jgi:hypothetical protein